jgi:3-hydroxybutyryl-CoA dehydrogenase
MFARRLPALRSIRRYSSVADVSSLGVVGAGQMGLGIALVAAKVAQVPVTLVDTNQASLDKSLGFMGLSSCDGI